MLVGGAKILVQRCWRGVSQVKVLCASLLADLCLNQTHMEQVVASGGICVLLHLERQAVFLSHLSLFHES